ncbi:MAG: hypothetical protein HYY42_02570 [Chloroflexi bacterium]|nr:hypothetical protein [Chloroflexota bacterium]MBI2983060.1 hypothetical protein [Chloroflexota bacterium]
MNILRRLREEAKKFDCSVCGTNHTRSDIRVLGKLDAAWIVRVTCSTCSTAFKLLVVVEEQKAAVTPVKEERPRAGRRAPMTSDDVLDAHETLREFQGDVSALFKRPAATARGSRRD